MPIGTHSKFKSASLATEMTKQDVKFAFLDRVAEELWLGKAQADRWLTMMADAAAATQELEEKENLNLEKKSRKHCSRG